MCSSMKKSSRVYIKRKRRLSSCLPANASGLVLRQGTKTLVSSSSSHISDLVNKYEKEIMTILAEKKLGWSYDNYKNFLSDEASIENNPELFDFLHHEISEYSFKRFGSSYDQMLALMILFVRGILPSSPSHLGPLIVENEEDRTMIESIMKLGALTIDSQSGICQNGEWQRGYCMFFVERDKFSPDRLLSALKNVPSIYFEIFDFNNNTTVNNSKELIQHMHQFPDDQYCKMRYKWFDREESQNRILARPPKEDEYLQNRGEIFLNVTYTDLNSPGFALIDDNDGDRSLCQYRNQSSLQIDEENGTMQYFISTWNNGFQQYVVDVHLENLIGVNIIQLQYCTANIYHIILNLLSSIV